MSIIEIERKVINPNKPTTNEAFSTIIPKLQLAYDSVSSGALKTCGRYYELSIIEGYYLTGEAPELDFGIKFHKSLEVYETLKATGQSHDQALKNTLGHTLEETWDHDRGRPWTTSEPTRSRDTLLRTIVWYTDKYKDENLKTLILPNGKPAVEYRFRLDLDIPAPTGETYQLCGHLDRVVEWNTGLWIMDHKTTKYDLDDQWFLQFTPDNQMSIYDIAGAIIFDKPIEGIIINGIQVQVNGSKFRRKPIPRSNDQRSDWLRDFGMWLKTAEMYTKNNHYPQNEKSCGWGRRQCMFRPVCSADPSVRKEMLDGAYGRRTWNPLEIR